MTGLASCAPTKSVSDVSLMAVLFMPASFDIGSTPAAPINPLSETAFLAPPGAHLTVKMRGNDWPDPRKKTAIFKIPLR